MESDKIFNIPTIDSVPDELFVNRNYHDAFVILGFDYANHKYERLFTNGKESIKVSIIETIFQWVILLPAVNINARIMIAPKEFSIQENLTMIEILAILYVEWKEMFKRVDIPAVLRFGQLYLEHIKNLKLSRPPKPFIVVERDYFRFLISKIKKEQIRPFLNDDLLFSISGDQLFLLMDSRKYSLPVVHNENITNEQIKVSLSEFLEMIPARFQRDRVSIRMAKEYLVVDNRRIKASWDGPDLWEHDEYDNFLSKRLIHISLFGR